MASVLIGYEVGTGAPVEVPLKHLAVTGQTQESGKTTTLEALVARSGVKAVAFVTKRGEGSFGDARTIPPYFREQADWQFVASILEASRGEKLKFERAWIIRASKGATTLADVQRNVRKQLETAKGMNADVYLTLDAYLDAVVPQIDRVRWAARVVLEPGLNVMDLTALNVEMQHLVIRSTITWVLDHETNTVVVVPEAWKFIPQGRGTPVKLAAESFIRQAAGLKNYLWLDSQDIAGVEKIILKSVPLWVLGVQREANEVKRTLDQIPGGIKKPKPNEIATLALGQFFVCYSTHTIKVYVQPTWMAADEAQAIARGERAIRAPAKATPPKERTVNESEARALREENEQLRGRIAELEAASRRFATAMNEAPARPAAAPTAGAAPVSYEEIKRRLIADAGEDPMLLKVLIQRPEIRVEVERQVITVDGQSTRGRLARLIAEGFFAQSRTSSDVLSELERRGRKPSNIELGNELKALMEMGFFTRENKWYSLVDGMVANVVER